MLVGDVYKRIGKNKVILSDSLNKGDLRGLKLVVNEYIFLFVFLWLGNLLLRMFRMCVFYLYRKRFF